MIGLILAGFGFTFLTWTRLDSILERLVRVEVQLDILNGTPPHRERHHK